MGCNMGVIWGVVRGATWGVIRGVQLYELCCMGVCVMYCTC